MLKIAKTNAIVSHKTDFLINYLHFINYTINFFLFPLLLLKQLGNLLVLFEKIREQIKMNAICNEVMGDFCIAKEVCLTRA